MKQRHSSKNENFLIIFISTVHIGCGLGSETMVNAVITDFFTSSTPHQERATMDEGAPAFSQQGLSTFRSSRSQEFIRRKLSTEKRVYERRLYIKNPKILKLSGWSTTWVVLAPEDIDDPVHQAGAGKVPRLHQLLPLQRFHSCFTTSEFKLKTLISKVTCFYLASCPTT
jgi:hypothetical protein